MSRLLIAVAFVLYAGAAVSGLTSLFDVTALETLGLVGAGLACEALAKQAG